MQADEIAKALLEHPDAKVEVCDDRGEFVPVDKVEWDPATNRILLRGQGWDDDSE